VKVEDFRDMLRRDMQLDRDALAAVLAERPEGPALVGKHEAKNWVHLRAVIAEAQETCPRAAETIRWLLWHDVLYAQRVLMIAEDISIKGALG
jgi:hypothetical protein